MLLIRTQWLGAFVDIEASMGIDPNCEPAVNFMLTGLPRRNFLIGLGAAAGTSMLPAINNANATPRYPNMIGRVSHHVTKFQDTLLDLARWNGLGFTEMISANRNVDPWVPGGGNHTFIACHA